MAWDPEKIGKKLTRAGQGFGEKVKETAGVVQLRQKKLSAENELEDLFAEIGKAYYESHKEEDGGELAELFSKVAAVTARINLLQDELTQLRGTKICPQCGAELALDAAFCSKCGAEAAMPAPAEEAPAEEEEAPAEEPAAEEDAGDDFAAEAEEAAECVCETAEEAAECACETAEEAAECACETAEDAAEEAAEAAEEAAEAAQDKLEEAAEDAQKKAEAFAETAEKAAEKAVKTAQDLAKEAWVHGSGFVSGLKDRFHSED